MPSILEGLCVLELGTGAASAFATMLLADQGARVVRVCDLGEAGPRAGGFIVWDRGKEVVSLDVAEAAANRGSTAGQFWSTLVAGADVLIDDLAPSSPLQALIEPAWLARINPRLAACSITAYGKRGALRDEPPIDDLVLARMGVLGGMPGFRAAPVHVVHPLPSVGAAILAALGVASALLARARTGRGRIGETSLMAGALLYHPKVDGTHIPAHVFQTHPAGSAPFYSNYACADGAYLQLGCVHPRFITIAAGLMGIGALVAEPRFDQGRGGKTPADVQELRETVARIMKTRSASAWAADFEAADVPFAPARSSEEGLSDPQVLHNGMVTTLEDLVVGAVTQMGVPIAFSRTPGRVPGPRSADVYDTRLPPDWPKAHSTSLAPRASAIPEPPPLDGVRILEITNLIAGPTCGRLLADLGADVIKLEPPGGDLSRPIGRTYFYAVNFEKRSISVDTSTPQGKDVAQRIAVSADALVANLRPHATERMGITPALNPRLIETHLTGYGWTGPYAKRPGIDPLAQALMGLQRAQGGPDNPPVFPAQLAPTDYTTGALGALGTVLALYARARTGVVQRVDANLLTGAILLSSAWFTRYTGKPERPLSDKDQYGLGPFHRLFRVSDGWIYVVARTADEQRAVLEIAGVRDAPTTGAARVGQHPNEMPLAQALAEAFSRWTHGDLLAALRRGNVACADAQRGDSALFLEDPHALENGMVAVRTHPTAGRLRVAWQSIQFADTTPPAGRPTALLGQHTDEVLREVGYGEADIAALHADGIVKTERG